MTNLGSILKIRDITLLTKCLSSQSYGFSSSHVWMWELDHKEGWTPKDWYFWAVVLEKTLESPLDCKETKPVNPKGNQSWMFIGRTDAEAEASILWPPDAKSQFIRKDSDTGKDWRREEKGMTEDEMVGWHHQLHEHEFEQALGDGEGQGSLACCSLWGHKESHGWATEQQAEVLTWHFCSCPSPCKAPDGPSVDLTPCYFYKTSNRYQSFSGISPLKWAYQNLDSMLKTTGAHLPLCPSSLPLSCGTHARSFSPKLLAKCFWSVSSLMKFLNLTVVKLKWKYE